MHQCFPALWWETRKIYWGSMKQILAMVSQGCCAEGGLSSSPPSISSPQGSLRLFSDIISMAKPSFLWNTSAEYRNPICPVSRIGACLLLLLNRSFIRQLCKRASFKWLFNSSVRKVRCSRKEKEKKSVIMLSYYSSAFNTHFNTSCSAFLFLSSGN